MATETATDRTGTMRGSRLWSVAAGVFVLFVGCAIGVGVAGFAELFADFDTELPGLTAALLAIPPVAWIGGGLVAAVLVVAKDLVVARSKRFAWNAVVCLAGIAILILFQVAMFLPVMGLTESVS